MTEKQSGRRDPDKDMDKTITWEAIAERLEGEKCCAPTTISDKIIYLNHKKVTGEITLSATEPLDKNDLPRILKVFCYCYSGQIIMKPFYTFWLGYALINLTKIGRESASYHSTLTRTFSYHAYRPELFLDEQKAFKFNVDYPQNECKVNLSITISKALFKGIMLPLEPFDCLKQILQSELSNLFHSHSKLQSDRLYLDYLPIPDEDEDRTTVQMGLTSGPTKGVIEDSLESEHSDLERK